MILRKSILILGLLFLSMGATSLAHADFERGLEAYESENYATALKEFLESANDGDAKAQYYLGIMYYNGQGVPKNDTEAARWSRLAAYQGYAKGQFSLGAMYYAGWGVPQDYTEAFRWYRLAADQGYFAAQYALWGMYVNGEEGVAQNYVLAEMWYILTAAQGYDWSSKSRSAIRKIMTPEQIAEAEKLAQEWLEEHQ